MTAAGFSTSGIVAGSLAASTQAGIGNVAVGSAFAIAQSLGAAGVYATIGITGGIGLIGVGAAYGGYKLYQWKHKPKMWKI